MINTRIVKWIVFKSNLIKYSSYVFKVLSAFYLNLFVFNTKLYLKYFVMFDLCFDVCLKVLDLAM